MRRLCLLLLLGAFMTGVPASAQSILAQPAAITAQDEQGRLFGFDRIQTLLARPVTAADIAAAAQKFGQQDDISILSITRTAVLEEALA